MAQIVQKKLLKEFVEYWKDKESEKKYTQKFWLNLLSVLGVQDPVRYIEFENNVLLKNMSFIDGYICSAKVLIEQKPSYKDLNSPIKQSDGSMLTSFEQAKRYISGLPVSMHPKWIVTCNFTEFHVYDMDKPHEDPQIIELNNLVTEYYRLNFLITSENNHLKKLTQVSMQAGEIVGKIYDAFAVQYMDITKEQSQLSLNKLCVRLVFCLYAEDAGVFGKRNMFFDYLNLYKARDMRKALIDLFHILNTPVDERDPYLENELAKFPYVNGGMFDDEDIEIPRINDGIRELLLLKASDSFDWSEISPTIFGAVFESTLNPETRRIGGMHYTSLENIHKVIDPLFLNELKEELENIKRFKQPATIVKKVKGYQEKLSKLTFLDPACGSGNFLTETYISLRQLENEAIKLFVLNENKENGPQIQLGFTEEGVNPIKVSIQQLYGIEINDFAVSVAKTALWIAESQMMKKTEEIVHMDLNYLPLKSYINIVEKNALRIDWNEVIPANQLNYIIGNPPFKGTKYQTVEQKEDVLYVSKELKKLDYVTGWFKKASNYINNTSIQCALVSTNSITQGEQVAILWKILKIHINFAYRTFIWDSQASSKAHVHCVIIGFSNNQNKGNKYIFNNNTVTIAKHINGYLIDAPNILVEKTSEPLVLGVPKMSKGSQPTDGGNLILSEEERKKFVANNPNISKYIRKYMGANDLLNNKVRYCLWLKNCSPSELRKMPDVIKRLELVKKSRLASPKKETRKWADRPYLFTEDRQPNESYIILPVVSSEKRKYMPIAYVSKDVVANTNSQMIPNANMYHLGMLMSSVHMAWMRIVAGRMKSDYAYSATIVYNNFPWPTLSKQQEEIIANTGQSILDARKLFPNSSLAELYDELIMPKELRKAHQENDREVLKAFGFKAKITEVETVRELLDTYQKLVKRKSINNV